MRRMLLPICSTSLIRYKVLNCSGLRGTLLVPRSSSIPTGKPPGVTISI